MSKRLLYKYVCACVYIFLRVHICFDSSQSINGFSGGESQRAPLRQLIQQVFKRRSWFSLDPYMESLPQDSSEIMRNDTPDVLIRDMWRLGGALQRQTRDWCDLAAAACIGANWRKMYEECVQVCGRVCEREELKAYFSSACRYLYPVCAWCICSIDPCRACCKCLRVFGWRRQTVRTDVYVQKGRRKNTEDVIWRKQHSEETSSAEINVRKRLAEPGTKAKCSQPKKPLQNILFLPSYERALTWFYCLHHF